MKDNAVFKIIKEEEKFLTNNFSGFACLNGVFSKMMNLKMFSE